MSKGKSADSGKSYEGACPYAPEHESDEGADDCKYTPSHVDPVIDGATGGGGIALNADYKPTPSIVNNANFYPGTESLSVGEMRLSFCGTAPFPPRLKQAGTCIMVELGQGPGKIDPVPRRPKRYFFDLGPGSSRNITAMGVSFPEVNDIFFTHLHGDHIAELGYYYCFAPWSARWTPLRVYGPDGADGVPQSDGTYPEYLTDLDFVADRSAWTWGEDGVVNMVQGMEKMFRWHAEAFKVFPAGDGYRVQAHQFNHRKGLNEEGPGLCYNQDIGVGQNVKIYHWPRIHAKSGASAYRLEWTFPYDAERDGEGNDNGDGTTTLRFVWTGDGRPNDLTLNYAREKDDDNPNGADAPMDVLVTECQTDVPEVMGTKYGFPPELYEYTIDTHHTVHYAVGHVMATCNPRIGMITHAEYDTDTMNELIAGVRYHWNGMFALGAPDGIVVNVTKDAIWYREAVLPELGPAGTPSAEHMIEYVKYYDGAEADWKHKDESGNDITRDPNEIPVPNPENDIEGDDGILDQEIADTETIPCKYYPKEVNRPLTTTWPENTSVELPPPDPSRPISPTPED